VTARPAPPPESLSLRNTPLDALAGGVWAAQLTPRAHRQIQASINSHLSKELARRDDLWSVLYVLIECVPTPHPAFINAPPRLH